jgi:ectoine hydroxylase-related dioxygenase (phytanoyl-CoA dioxygenase family)
MTNQIDAATIEAFRRDGCAPLYGVFADWVDTLRKGIDHNFENPSSHGKMYQGEEGGGWFLSDYCNWADIPEYKDFVTKSDAARIGADLMGAKSAQLFHEHVLVKQAKAGVATPWHQDAPYYCVDAPMSVSIWIPLDEVPRERTLEFVSGSHQWGKNYRPQRFNGQALNEDDGLEEIPDINGARDDFDILGWALKPGDAVAFDYRTVHGAPANNSASSQRRAFSLRMVGEGATFARREGVVTSPPFEHVTLAHGTPLSGDDFPVLYTA